MGENNATTLIYEIINLVVAMAAFICVLVCAAGVGQLFCFSVWFNLVYCRPANPPTSTRHAHFESKLTSPIWANFMVLCVLLWAENEPPWDVTRLLPCGSEIIYPGRLCCSLQRTALAAAAILFLIRTILLVVTCTGGWVNYVIAAVITPNYWGYLLLALMNIFVTIEP